MNRRHREDPTGYSGPGDEREEEPRHQRWWLERYDRGYFSPDSTVTAHLKCNGETRGLLRLKSEEEFEWLKSRIAGERVASEFDPDPDKD